MRLGDILPTATWCARRWRRSPDQRGDEAGAAANSTLRRPSWGAGPSRVVFR
jgi:hypothetical protein